MLQRVLVVHHEFYDTIPCEILSLKPLEKLDSKRILSTVAALETKEDLEMLLCITGLMESTC